jgi:hypothetical protein
MQLLYKVDDNLKVKKKNESLFVHNFLHVVGADIMLYYSFHHQPINPNIPTNQDDELDDMVLTWKSQNKLT